MKTALAQYYTSHNANIEFYLGEDLFQEDKCGYDYPTIKSLFPFLYNIWHEILVDYFDYVNFKENIIDFNNSIRSYIDKEALIYTTNFDRYFEALSPAHLHGTFVNQFKRCSDLILKHFDDEQFYYKCIWGWNGRGKLNFIDQIRAISGYNRYFDFGFFYGKTVHINNLLIYGIGFQTAGFIPALAAVKPEYLKPVVGGIVDEHILIRLKGMQTQGQLKGITFAYYSDSELQHFQDLANLYEVANAKFIKSSTLNFTTK